MKRPLNAKDVAEQLAKLAGNLAAVARHFGVTRQAVFAYVRKRPALQMIEQDCRESLKDIAEGKLQAAIRKGEAWAICFFLKTQAKDRGFVERAEYSGPGGAPIQVEHSGSVEVWGEIDSLSVEMTVAADAELHESAGIDGQIALDEVTRRFAGIGQHSHPPVTPTPAANGNGNGRHHDHASGNGHAGDTDHDARSAADSPPAQGDLPADGDAQPLDGAEPPPPEGE